MYRSSATPSPETNQMPGPPVYPKVGQPSPAAFPPVGRPSPLRNTATHSPSSGLGIKVAVKPEYKITSPLCISIKAAAVLQVWVGKILTEDMKESPKWSSFGVENLPTKGAEAASPVVREFVKVHTILREMGVFI